MYYITYDLCKLLHCGSVQNLSPSLEINTITKALPDTNLPTLREKAFENIVQKEKNAGKQHFLLFPRCLLPLPNTFEFFRPISIRASLKFCCFGRVNSLQNDFF